MPLYEWQLLSGTVVEVYRPLSRMDEAPEPGAVRLFSAPALLRVDRANDVVVGTRRNKPAVLKREGGGTAVLNRQTGGYRPALTHQAFCPICGQMRMVAILGVQGERRNRTTVNCECGYVWIHSYGAPTMPGDGSPLVEGYDGSLRIGQQSGSKYEAPERGV